MTHQLVKKKLVTIADILSEYSSLSEVFITFSVRLLETIVAVAKQLYNTANQKLFTLFETRIS